MVGGIPRRGCGMEKPVEFWRVLCLSEQCPSDKRFFESEAEPEVMADKFLKVADGPASYTLINLDKYSRIEITRVPREPTKATKARPKFRNK